MLIRTLILFFLIPLHSSPIFAEELSGIAVINIQTSIQPISLSKLSDLSAREIETTAQEALINDGQSLWTIKKGARTLSKLRLNGLPEDANWFNSICSTEDSLFVAVSNYPESQRNTDLGGSRGTFIVGPHGLGFLFIMLPTSIGAWSYTHLPKITSRPIRYPNPSATESQQSIDEIQSCSWNGNDLFFGSYGALGKVNRLFGTIDLLNEDTEQSLSRFPLLAEKSGLWYAVDEGGLGGAALIHHPFDMDSISYAIHNGEDVVAYRALIRHDGHLIVGTTHGLFLLDERSGNFQRFEFSQSFPDLHVTSLISHNNSLWAFMGGNWLKIDLTNSRAVQYLTQPPSNWVSGRPFDGSWILLSSNGIWKSNRNTPKP